MRTKAQRRLAALLGQSGSVSRAAVGRRLGVTGQAVSAWARGLSRPQYWHRMALERLFGIPAVDWETNSERARTERLSDISSIAVEKAS